MEEGLKEKKEIQERIIKARAEQNECLRILKNKYLSKNRIAGGVKFLQSNIIPTLTFGAETWNELTEKEKDELNSPNKLLSKPTKSPRNNPQVCAYRMPQSHQNRTHSKHKETTILCGLNE